MSQPLIDLALGAVGQIPSLLALAVIYFLTRYILKIIRLVFVNIELGVIHVHRFQATWTWPTYRILGVVVSISTQVGIGYEEPHRKIEAMLLEAVSRTPGLKTEPAPVVLRSELGDFAVVHEVRVSPEKVDALVKLKSALHENILDVFNERGVQIMTPAHEDDPEEPKVAPVDTPLHGSSRGTKIGCPKPT